MKKSYGCLVGALAFLGPAHAQNPLHDYVVSGDTATAALPPVAVSQGRVVEGIWSSDGQFLLVASLVPSGYSPYELLSGRGSDVHEANSQLVIRVYNARTQETKDVLSLPSANYALKDLQFLHDTHTAFASMEELEFDKNSKQPLVGQSLLEIDAERATNSSIASVPLSSHEEAFELSMAPERAVGILSVGEPTAGFENRVVAYLIDGSSSTRRLAESIDFGRVVWGADGKQCYLAVPGRPARYVSLDLATGATAEVSGVPKRYLPPPDPSPLRLVRSVGTTHLDAKNASRNLTLWLSAASADEPNRIVLSKDIGSAKPGLDSIAVLSPSHDNVFFVSQGIALVRPLVQVPIEEFRRQQRLAFKDDAMQRSKQIGLALLLYANDMNDQLPPSNADLKSLLDPYLNGPDNEGDPNMLSGFSYTNQQSDLTQIASPAETTIGYISTPFGRAVLYSDGHVKWQNEP